MAQDASLFPQPQPPEPAPDAGLVAGIALERSLDRVLSYTVPRGLAGLLAVGQRVRVPLGKRNRPVAGYVVELAAGVATGRELKPVMAILDERVLLRPKMLELARWMSRYYCCPLGTVIETMLPAAVRKRVGLDYATMVALAVEPVRVQEMLESCRGPRRRAILGRLLQIPARGREDLGQLAGDAGCKPAAIRSLAKLGVVKLERVPLYDTGPESLAAAGPPTERLELNEDQQRALDELRPRLTAGFSVSLLLGVTGSGKTEVYLRCLEEVLAAGKRGIVMVPEIALTPQTVQRFTARLGSVAVLHSGLAAGARHRFWRQVASGEARVVVGARSAVFAPVPDLGIIIVDEEHEGSYKQDSAPRYNGRDVAVKLGQLEGVPVILGSATPALESYHRARSGAYRLVTLPHRVRGLALPQVELVDMRQEARQGRRGIHLLSLRLESLLKAQLEAGRQAILLLNRRGYSNFVYCPSCQHLMQCKYCDVTMTYHRSAPARVESGSVKAGLHTGQLHCHYCLAVNTLPECCPVCGKSLTLFGLGTQRVEEELARKFPGVTFARADSDSLHSLEDYEKVLAGFAAGQVRVLLGTQMIAKGLDYPNVTLVGVISGDTALSLPDFRAAERTFALITQAAGRAGRGDHPGRVVLQTFLPADPTLAAALRQDYVAFAESELRHREQVGLPPFTRMARIILRDQSLDKLQDHCQTLAARIDAALGPDRPQVVVKGPMPCAIARIAGYHRAQMLLLARDPGRLQVVLARAREAGAFASAEHVAVDVDPLGLL